MKKLIWKLTKNIILLIFIFIIGVTIFMNYAPVFGGNPDKNSLDLMTESTNYDGQIFKNLVPTVLETPSSKSFSIIEFFNPPVGKNPNQPLPSITFDKNKFKNGDFVWYGHSTILMKTEDVTVMTDPIFYSASPVSFLVKPFDMQAENTISQLPEIDIVLISHDHYDHLDYRAIQEMDSKVKKYIVPLGVKAHLQRWGIMDIKIEELDWYHNYKYASVSFTLTPSRHFSGRGFTNRFTTLWGSWVVKSQEVNIYFSGDSGYFDEFKKIGNQFGPFDMAFIENGAYNDAWNQIHMYPEQSVRASLDLQAKVFFPIHWGKFDLSVHDWKDPIIRASTTAKDNQVKIVTPMIGETFTLSNYPTSNWWQY